MPKVKDQLAQWAIHQIETHYPQDVSLLIHHNTHTIPPDLNDVTFGFYIPATNRANGLNQTFIIDGIGHDLFPMPWHRIENMADGKDYNLTCLVDGEILWARTEADRQRFTSLQARLKANMENPQYMRQQAITWLDAVGEIFQNMLFEDRVYKVRENAGDICDLLARAMGLINGHHFKYGQTHQLAQLKEMADLPADFITHYQNIFAAPNPDTQKRYCHQLIQSTKAFIHALENPAPCDKPAPDFTELADWYQEITYWWRRVYYWCDQQDPTNAYIWGCNLQREVDEWGTKFGIAEVDIMGAYDPANLTAFRRQAEASEQAFRKAITDQGVTIREYATIADFLSAQGVAQNSGHGV